MKKIVIILLFVIFISILFLIKLKGGKKMVEISEIKSFHFGYSVNMMMNGNVSYDVKLLDDKYIATIKPYMIDNDDALEIELSDSQVETLRNILIDNKVNKWDGFDKADKNVLDGNSFSLFIHFVNKDSISAKGYMNWPENYGKVSGCFDEFFNEIYKTNRNDFVEE